MMPLLFFGEHRYIHTVARRDYFTDEGRDLFWSLSLNKCLVIGMLVQSVLSPHLDDTVPITVVLHLLIISFEHHLLTFVEHLSVTGLGEVFHCLNQQQHCGVFLFRLHAINSITW